MIYSSLFHNTILPSIMLILMTLLSLALVDARGIRGTSCTSDDGSVVPSCYEHLTPELEGLSFYLPHQNSE